MYPSESFRIPLFMSFQHLFTFLLGNAQPCGFQIKMCKPIFDETLATMLGLWLRHSPTSSCSVMPKCKHFVATLAIVLGL